MSASFSVRHPQGSVENPAVSVVIPCYKVTEFIPDALDSVLRQTFRSFEIVVVNDGCPDTENLERVLAPYSDEIVYIVQENQGPSAARNAGILVSRAPLIAFLDGDNIWEPNYLDVQVAYIEAHPEVDVVCPDARFFGNSKAAGRRREEICPTCEEPSFISIAARRYSPCTELLTRKAALVNVGLFDPALRFGEDLDLWARMLRAGSRFEHHGIPLVRIRLRVGSLIDSCIDMPLDYVLACYKKWQSWPDLSLDERDAITEGIDHQVATFDLLAGKRALYAGDFDEALSRFLRANRVFKTNRLRVAITALRVFPQLLQSYVHRRYPTERLYIR